MTDNQERDFERGIDQFSLYDRSQTANTLGYSYNENTMKANAYHTYGYVQPEILQKIEAMLRIKERNIFYLECDSVLDEYQHNGIVIYNKKTTGRNYESPLPAA